MRWGKSPDATRALANVPLFSGLDKKHLEFLASHSTQIEVKEGKTLIEEGRMGREAMVIVDGTAVATRGDEEISRMGPGDVIGEMSLINQVRRTATVTATSDCTLLVMDSQEFASVLENNPDVSLAILRTVAERLQHDADV